MCRRSPWPLPASGTPDVISHLPACTALFSLVSLGMGRCRRCYSSGKPEELLWKLIGGRPRGSPAAGPRIGRRSGIRQKLDAQNSDGYVLCGDEPTRSEQSRRLAWPLRKEVTHTSRSVHRFAAMIMDETPVLILAPLARSDRARSTREPRHQRYQQSLGQKRERPSLG